MTSTLGTARVHDLDLEWPTFGSPEATAVLDVGTPPAVGTRTTLTVGDLTLPGLVIRSGLDAPDRPRVTLLGGAGWDRLVGSPLSYQSDAGVRLSTVLAALSDATGEPLEPPGDATIGNYYELLAAHDGDPVRYRDALDELARAGALAPWRVDPDGVTSFGPRVGVEVTARATVLVRGADGYQTLGIDAPKAFLPGNLLGGKVITKLVVTERNASLQATVWFAEPAAPPTLRASVQRMTWSLLQDFVRTMVVDTVQPDKRLDLVPPSDAQHLPEMRNVEQWCVGGLLTVPPPGTEVLVMFRDRKRTRPIVMGFAPGTAAGSMLAVARVNDTVAVPLLPATFSGTINGSPATGIVIWPGQTMGSITIGTPRTVG